MKKNVVLFIFTCFLLQPIHVFCDNKIVEPYKKIIETPKVEAQGAILIDEKTGRVLWEKNANTPLAMASTTKIMTAILALENGKMTDKVLVSKRAAAAPKVKMNLVAGEEITLQSLLYALMLQSSNDAAVAIAEHIGGTVENFCQMMTDKAHELGAVNTTFKTPNGLDAQDHKSTAYDLAIITKYAYENPQFVKLIGTKDVTFESSKKSYYVANKNRLLNEFPGADGVKTGYTGQAGQCFVGSAKQDGMRLISVVLASGWGEKGKEQKWIDTKRILNYGFTYFDYVDVLKKGSPMGEIPVTRSKTDQISLYLDEGLTMLLREDEHDAVRMQTNLPQTLKAPVALGEKIGEAHILLDGKLYQTIDILAEQSASRHDLKTSLETVLNEFLELGTNQEVHLTLPEF